MVGKLKEIFNPRNNKKLMVSFAMGLMWIPNEDETLNGQKTEPM
jgi:hypothetical protein